MTKTKTQTEKAADRRMTNYLRRCKAWDSKTPSEKVRALERERNRGF